MEIDLARHLGAVARHVEERDHNGEPARVVRAERTYTTTVEDLWDAISRPERIPRWFLPVSGDLRLGGRYQLQGNAGGEIVRCEPPRHLHVTWEYGNEVSWLTVELTETPEGGAHLRLEHVAHVDPDRWREFGPGAVGVGWDMTLMGLDEHLAAGAGLDPSGAAEWMGSENGRAFMRRASQAWGAAAVEAGGDPVAAREAAARTTAFYTGEPVGTGDPDGPGAAGDPAGSAELDVTPTPTSDPPA